MGDVIYLSRRRAERARRPSGTKPAFFFDLGCPFSYLTAERIERALGDVEWIPVASAALGRELTAPGLEALRERAEALARTLRLPLVWPECFPAAAPRALRAAAHAGEIGAGASFALAASRLAFCGGFDLEDPETLAEAAAAAAVGLDDCLNAAASPQRDGALLATAAGLRARGVAGLPAIGVGPRLFTGETGLLAARAMLHRTGEYRRPLAPAG